MNPEMSAPQFNPERTPVDYGQSAERDPAELTPEKAIELREREQKMKAVDHGPAMSAATPVLPMPAQQAQVVPMPAPVTQSDDNNPVVAADDDLIEREWVDKAKKIVAESRNEPYKMAREVSKLQADYLHKRYGREIGIST